MSDHDYVHPALRERFGHMSSDVLEAGSRRAHRRASHMFTLAVVLFLSGIWLDWRFLPTACVPFGYALLRYYVAGSLGRLAAAARAREGLR